MSNWKLRRGEDEWDVGDELLDWAKEGRIRPSDYLFNPVLGRWMYANEVEEVKPFFRPKPPSQVNPARVVVLLLIVLAVLWILNNVVVLK